MERELGGNVASVNHHPTETRGPSYQLKLSPQQRARLLDLLAQNGVTVPQPERRHVAPVPRRASRPRELVVTDCCAVDGLAMDAHPRCASCTILIGSEHHEEAAVDGLCFLCNQRRARHARAELIGARSA